MYIGSRDAEIGTSVKGEGIPYAGKVLQRQRGKEKKHVLVLLHGVCIQEGAFPHLAGSVMRRSAGFAVAVTTCLR